MKIDQGHVESEGHRLAYLAVNEHLGHSAEQPPVVFIHGVLASVNFWRDCVPPSFSENRAWYALSLPAHFPSTVPADFSSDQVDDAWFYRIVNGALEKLLHGRKAIIVGHSTGGYSALNLAAHHSPHILGIISVAGFHSGKWTGVEGQLVKLAGLGNAAKPLFMANLALAKRSLLIRRVFASLLAHDHRAYRANPLSRKMLDNVGPDVMQQDAAALFQLFNGIYALEVLDNFEQIRMPTYLFVGTHDPVVPAKQSLAMAGHIPQAHTVVFNNVGHMPFIEATDAYFDALEDAVKDITEQATH